MFFLITFILAMITLLLMTDIPRVSVILLSLVVAAFGAQIEADSWRGLDNLFVPIGLHLFLQANLATPATSLVAGAIVYLGLLGGLVAAAPRIGLTRHAARGYSVFAFLILSVTSPQNALLPLAAFASFLALQRRCPCRSSYPDLDFLAAAAGVAALWLFVGEWSGHNAINFYNLTFAGVAAIFATLLLRKQAWLAVAIATALGIVVYGIQFLNVEQSRWMTSFSVTIVLSVALCCAVALAWPDLFQRHRSPRGFALALSLPFVVFTFKSFSP
jgi:hypothetical protein